MSTLSMVTLFLDIRAFLLFTLRKAVILFSRYAFRLKENGYV